MKYRSLFLNVSLFVASFSSELIPMEPAPKNQRVRKKQEELRQQLAQRQQTNISVASKSLRPAKLNPLIRNTIDNHYQAVDRNKKIPEILLLFLDACTNGNYPEASQYLVEQKVPVDSEDGLNVTALGFACGNGRLKIAQLLVEHGANVNQGDAQQITPLHRASMFGNSDLVELLVNAGAKINVSESQQKEYPLHYAACQGHIKTVKVLVDHHAEVDVKNNRNCTPLFFACKAGHLETVKFLVTSKAAINMATISGMTPLHIASYNGHIEIVQFLITQGANIYAKNGEGATPADLARQNHHHAILVFLNQLDPSISTDTPKPNIEHLAVNRQFILACSTGNREYVYKLLEHPKIDINSKHPKTGDTPLHYACDKNDAQLVKQYLKRGANRELQNCQGATPLHIACERGHHNIVRILLKAGANTEAQDYTLGVRPLHFAVDRQHFLIVQVLIENGAQVEGENIHGSTPLMAACQKDNNNIIEYLLIKNGDVTKKDILGVTALHYACIRGAVPAIKLLLAYNSDIEAETNIMMTPLMVASQYGHADAVKFLLNRGANPHAKTCHGITSAHYAALLNHREVLRALLKAKADVNAESNKGLSVLDFIYNKEDCAILKILAECGIPTISDQEAERAQHEFFAQLNKEEAQEENPRQGKNYKKNQRKKEKKQKERIEVSIDTPIQKTQEDAALPSIATNPARPQEEHIALAPLSLITPIQSNVSPQPIKTSKIAAKTIAQPAARSHTTPTHYRILMHEKFKWPKSLKEKQQQEMISKLKQLKNWPDTGGLDITNLKGNTGMFRLRVGNHRILFSVDHHAIKIHQIGLRKNVYKNI